MSVFVWENLKNSELSSRLERLKEDEHCEKLFLYPHRLTRVPDLTQYRQFDNLQLLKIAHQKSQSELGVIEPCHIPLNVNHLELWDNKLSEVGDFSGHTRLGHLNLSNNNISVIEPCHIPLNVNHLNLWDNKLSEVGDFSGHTRLGYLDLSYNNISVIEPCHIPLNVNHLDLWGNKLSEVGDFSGHTRLGHLDLSYNNISVIEPCHIPLNVTHLNLWGNKLSEVGDFSGHTRLGYLDLRYNNISVIEPCHIPLNVTHLNLWGNKLSEVGDFSGHTRLGHLDLSKNNISVIEPCHIPLNVTHLELWDNKLSEVGDFSGHTRLGYLDLSKNNISVIEPCHIPLNVTHLNLFHNKLREIGDFSQHSHLSEMDIRSNKIHTIHGLPNNRLNLQAGNGIRVLGKKCIHRKTYQILKELTKKCGWVLQQPPIDVVYQGLETVMVYFDENLVRSGQTRMVLLGPTTAGKTSLMKSLVELRPVLVDVQDRTWVADVEEWDISAVDTILIYDQGGHEIYNITSPIFQGPNCIVLLVHDVTKVEDLELEKTAATLRQALQYHPDNQVYTVLTHTDLLDPVAAEGNMDLIKKRLEMMIDEEVLNRKLSDATEEVIQQSSLLTKQKENMKYFLISSKTYSGLNDLKDFLRHIVAEKRVKIPEKWVQLYKTMMQQSQNFWKVKDLKKCFCKLHSALAKQLQQSKIENQFMSALRYYRDAGHLLFFESVPNLNEFVFHNKEFIICLLKSCFSHDLRNVIDYRNDQSLQVLFGELQIELMLQQYQREGLLHKKLLYFLWQKHNFEVEQMDAFLELLKFFHLCYPIDKDSEILFFPWFVQNNTIPNEINPNKLSKLDATHFSVELDCRFVSSIPVNIFEMMLVQLQKTALDKEYDEERFAWKDGLMVQIGSIKCIAIRKQADSTVSICVRGYTKDLLSIWQITHDVYTDMKSTFVQFRGVIKTIHFNCNHCRAKGKTSVKKWLPNVVLQSKPLRVSDQRCHLEDIPSALVIAISAKVKNVEKHIKRVEEYLESVHKEQSPPGKLLYLDCEEVSEGEFELSWCWPQCNEGDVFSEAVDSTITHAVVEYRQGDQWKQVTEDVRQSPYTITCAVEEFRVAAANDNGAGEFINVTPCHIVDGDEFISENDEKHIRGNHEFFTRMSSVWEIVVRLFSRHAIDNRTKESVVRLLENARNPCKAADLLMESIYKMTYQELFLFQKTLRETGQMVMAESLPVRLEHEPEELVMAESLPVRAEHEAGETVMAQSLPVRAEHEPGEMVMAQSLPLRAEHEPGEMAPTGSLPVREEHESGEMVMADSLPVRVEHESGEMAMAESLHVRLEHEPGEMVMAQSLPVRVAHEILPPQRDDEGLAEPSVELPVLPQAEQHEVESTLFLLDGDSHLNHRILTYHRNY